MLALEIATRAHSGGGLTWGVVLVVLGVLHLVFRRHYARRAKAIHDARQDTAPSFSRGFYRRHSDSFYLTSEWMLGIFFIVGGLILIAVHA